MGAPQLALSVADASLRTHRTPRTPDRTCQVVNGAPARRAHVAAQLPAQATRRRRRPPIRRHKHGRASRGLVGGDGETFHQAALPARTN
jgi:hypothetical protein